MQSVQSVQSVSSVSSVGQFSTSVQSLQSVHERSENHARDARNKDEESHIFSHLEECHPDKITEYRDLFEFKILSSHKSSFSRQLQEAVSIMIFKGDTLLNRKEMFNRCIIPAIFLKDQNHNRNPKKHLKKQKNFNKEPMTNKCRNIEHETEIDHDHEKEHTNKRLKIDNDQVEERTEVIRSQEVTTKKKSRRYAIARRRTCTKNIEADLEAENENSTNKKKI